MISRRVCALGPLLLLGCAPDLAASDAPGQPCETDVDCNYRADGSPETCGWLRLCVTGRCEAPADAGGSTLVLCPAPEVGE
jgi:hypothetical protein